MPTTTEKTALIVGASRGLGLALVEEFAKRGWHVIGTARGNKKTDLHALAEKSDKKIEVENLDINEPSQVSSLKARLQSRTLDLLFVNAGVANETNHSGDRVSEVSTEEFMRVMLTNALSPLRVIEDLESLVPSGGTIGVMSSGLGSVTNNEIGSYEVYRGSKAALNTMMRSFGARTANKNRSVVVMCPGWVRTDMGGSTAPLSIDQSIPGVVDTITSKIGDSGVRYLDYQGKTVAW